MNCNNMEKMKSINLKKNKWLALPEKQFYHSTDGKAVKQVTEVKLKIDNQFLYVEFECYDNPFVNQNGYLEYNSEMYNQEVFEIFIASGNETPTRYLEIEINPNNALFVAWIENETGESVSKLEFVKHNNAGIMHGIQKGKKDWKGFMTIPLALISSKSNNYRLNFYRIISKVSHANSDWLCDASNCDFTCWSSTMSGQNPQFHRPEAFGFLKII